MNEEESKNLEKEMLQAMGKGSESAKARGKPNTRGPASAQSSIQPQAWQPRRLTVRRSDTPLPMRVSRPAENPSPPATDREGRRVPEKIPISSEPITPDDSVEQIAARRPEDVARAIQTVRLSAGKESQSEALDRIAILIIGLGTELSAPILKHCDWDEVQDITQAVIEIRTILPERRKAVFEEFRQLLLSGDYILTGGPEYAQRLLQRAFPREWVGRLHTLMRTASSPYNLFSEVDPRYLVPFIAKEHAQTIALILSQLDSAQSAGILTRLDPELQQDVAYRLATLDHVPLQTLRRLEDVLASDLRAIMSDQAAEIGGAGIVAKILGQTSRETEENIMSGLEDRSTELAQAVRDRSFVFEDILNLRDSEIKLVLEEVDPDDLVFAIKAASDSIKDILLKGLDEEGRKRLQTKTENSDRIRLADAEAAQERIARIVRSLNDQGKVMVVHGDAAEQFI